MAIFTQRKNSHESGKIFDALKNLFMRNDIKLQDSAALVFLCGASLKNEKSIRRQIQKYYMENKSNLHENREIVFLSSELSFIEYNRICGYLLNQGYSESIDLNSFEELIAAVVDCVLIILESSGSIAELGYFSAFREIRQKTLIVLEQEHYNVPSFIRLGPLSSIDRNTNFRPIQSYLSNDLNEYEQIPEHNLQNILRLILNYESSHRFSCASNSFCKASGKKQMI